MKTLSDELELFRSLFPDHREEDLVFSCVCGLSAGSVIPVPGRLFVTSLHVLFKNSMGSKELVVVLQNEKVGGRRMCFVFFQTRKGKM